MESLITLNLHYKYFHYKFCEGFNLKKTDTMELSTVELRFFQKRWRMQS